MDPDREEAPISDESGEQSSFDVEAALEAVFGDRDGEGHGFEDDSSEDDSPARDESGRFTSQSDDDETGEEENDETDEDETDEDETDEEEDDETDEDETDEDETDEEEDDETDEEDEEETPEESDPGYEEWAVRRYGSVEKALEAARQNESYLGQLRNDLGSLRSEIEQLRQGQQEIIESRPVPAETREQLLEYAEENPLEAVKWVIENAPHDYDLYRDAMRSYYNIDPFGASEFREEVNEMMRQAEQQATTQSMAEEQQRLQSQQLFNQAVQKVISNPEDRAYFTTENLQKYTQEYGEVMRLAATGPTIEAREQALKVLLRAMKGDNVDRIVEAKEKRRAANRARDKAAKRRAGITPGTAALEEKRMNKTQQDYLDSLIS